MEEMDLSQFKEVFMAEAKEHLVAVNSALVELEKNPTNKEMLAQIFRAAHTIKGMAATMGYEKITSLTHRMEDVLDKFKKGEMEIRKDVLDVIFKCLDALEKLVDDVGNDTDSKVDIASLMEGLNSLLSGQQKPSSQVQSVPVSAKPDIITGNKVEVPSLIPAEIHEVEKQKQSEDADPSAQSKKAQSSIRINISYLDTMMNLVGEMVISKSQLEQIGQKHNIEELNEALQQFDRIAVELQEAVLKTRMVTLSHIFDRYPRMFRDLSQKLEKDIDFEINGADIEIDRLLLDEINEPILHLLRNALDHGIENSQERQKSGKSAKGKIVLSAYRERGFISIKVTDDGKGLDPTLLKRKAIEKGIIDAATAEGMPDEEAYMLICDPRFSTAEVVSDISGRGVGMDVVKNAMESVNGHLVIQSQKGVGSSFVVNLPLTMAIISALLVKIGNETYAIALNNITEIVDYNKSLVKSVGGKEVIVLRDEVLPLIRLKSKLNAGSSSDVRSGSYILRVEASTKTACFVIDSFIGRKEIVIKTLAGLTKRAKGFAGATILGDGSVVLIIDVSSWI